MPLARRIGRSAALVVFAAVFATHALADEWRGVYHYRDGTPSVPFTLQMGRACEGSISGSTSEPNTFGNRSASQLFATINGTISGHSISFTKTYDGTGGVSHSVVYQGTLDMARRYMNGTWRVQGNTGTFVAEATGPVPQRPDLNQCMSGCDATARTCERSCARAPAHEQLDCRRACFRDLDQCKARCTSIDPCR